MDIKTDIQEFFSTTKISEARLCSEAGISKSIVSQLLASKRKYMLNQTESIIRDAMLRLKREQTKERISLNKGFVLIDKGFYSQSWNDKISAKARSMLFHMILRCYTHRDGIIPWGRGNLKIHFFLAGVSS